MWTVGHFLLRLAHFAARNPAAVVAAIGLVWGIPAYVLTRNLGIYSSLDSMYQSLLATALEHGALRNPERTASYRTSFAGDQLAIYETYAYMVFNLCETVADNLDFYRKRGWSLLDFMEFTFSWCFPAIGRARWLRKTWHPVLVAEKQLHGAWLANQEPGIRFKQRFLDLMKSIEQQRY